MDCPIKKTAIFCRLCHRTQCPLLIFHWIRTSKNQKSPKFSYFYLLEHSLIIIKCNFVRRHFGGIIANFLKNHHLGPSPFCIVPNIHWICLCFSFLHFINCQKIFQNYKLINSKKATKDESVFNLFIKVSGYTFWLLLHFFKTFPEQFFGTCNIPFSKKNAVFPLNSKKNVFL